MQEGTAADKDLRADGQLGKLVTHYARTSKANYYDIEQQIKGNPHSNNGSYGNERNQGKSYELDDNTFTVDTSVDDKRHQFDSKHFAVVELEPGVSALRKAGIERKVRLPKACLPRDDRPQHITIVKLSYMYHAESEFELPTVKNITATTDERLPTMLTMDATGRILEQHGNILRPTDGFCMIVPAAEVTLEMKDKQIAYHKEAVTARPKWFIGWPVHQHFSEWNGVCRGRIKSYDEENKYWKVLWEPDQKYTEYDAEDMYNYAIDLIDGKAEADGGHALMLRATPGNTAIADGSICSPGVDVICL